MDKKITKAIKIGLFAGLGITTTIGANNALAADCASLPASRATEFHGDLADNDLSLAMAGNQWVVFDQVVRAFNESRGLDNTTPAKTDAWSSVDYDNPSNRYFIELIPPGQETNQIISGCMTLGNEKETNFLPLVIRTKFDVFASTNYNLMQKLATNDFVTEAVPYTKNKLTLMVAAGNPANIGTGATDLDRIFDAAMDLLHDCDHDASGCTGGDPGIVVSEVDHINEGIHNGINKMYKLMDKYIRDNDPDPTAAGSMTAQLDTALAAVAIPQPGSPAETRTAEEGITTNFDLASNSHCHYWSDTDGDGVESTDEHNAHGATALRLCEYAVLNKSNTHETRVHHVETPSGILGKSGFTAVDVGPVWVSELQFAKNAGDSVDGSTMPDSVNQPVVYSLALLSTAGNNGTDTARIALAQDFINFLTEANEPGVKKGVAQQIYEAGGFLHMCYGHGDATTGCHDGTDFVNDFAGGFTYSKDTEGDLIVTPR